MRLKSVLLTVALFNTTLPHSLIKHIIQWCWGIRYLPRVVVNGGGIPDSRSVLGSLGCSSSSYGNELTSLYAERSAPALGPRCE